MQEFDAAHKAIERRHDLSGEQQFNARQEIDRRRPKIPRGAIFVYKQRDFDEFNKNISETIHGFLMVQELVAPWAQYVHKPRQQHVLPRLRTTIDQLHARHQNSP